VVGLRLFLQEVAGARCFELVLGHCEEPRLRVFICCTRSASAELYAWWRLQWLRVRSCCGARSRRRMQALFGSTCSAAAEVQLFS
jgi:hypothetical protein